MQDRPEILIPDLTFLLLVSPEIAYERIDKRGQRTEKFEQLDFMRKLDEQYRKATKIDEAREEAKRFYGKVIQIDANEPQKRVSLDIRLEFIPFYKDWEKVNSQK